MNCRIPDAELELALAVGGDADPETRARILRHVETCESCRRAWQALEQSQAALQRAARLAPPELPPGESLAACVLHRIARLASAQAAPRTPTGWSPLEPHAPPSMVLGWIPSALLAAASIMLLVYSAATPMAPAPSAPAARSPAGVADAGRGSTFRGVSIDHLLRHVNREGHLVPIHPGVSDFGPRATPFNGVLPQSDLQPVQWLSRSY